MSQEEKPETPAPVRRIGSIILRGKTYDLAANGHALLATEEKDIYGHVYAQHVTLAEVAGVDWSLLAQDLLDLLAVAIKDRDAAQEALRRES